MSQQPSSPLILTIVTSLIALTLFGLVTLDSFGNPESVHKLLGIHSYTFVPWLLAVLVFIRLRFGSLLHNMVSHLSVFIFVLGFVVSAVLAIYDWHTFPNASFALTRLNLPQLALLTFAGGSVFFLYRSNRWWKKYWKHFTFIFPFGLFLYLLVVRLFPFNVFLEIVKEDNIIEYSQFVVLVAGSLFSFWSAAKLRSRNLLYSSWAIYSWIRLSPHCWR